MSSYRIKTIGLCKKYHNPVLRDINLCVAKGAIHGLIGENGAGKSTLVKILSGWTHSDSGKILFDDKVFRPGSVRDAEQAGIRAAAQELSLIGNLSVLENILLRRLPTSRFGIIDRKLLLKEGERLAALVGLDCIDLNQPLETLSLGEKQLVELAKVFHLPSKLIILDEPTSALTNYQSLALHKTLKKIAHGGISIIYISHRLQDVLAHCDSISVLKDGILTMTESTSGLKRSKLIAEMSGKSRNPVATEKKVPAGRVRLKIRELQSLQMKHPISLSLRCGQILGIFGLAGSGRSALLEAIFALDERVSGDVLVMSDAGQISSPSNPVESVEAGIGFVPEDRKTQGIFASLSVASNISISTLPYLSRLGGIIAKNKETEEVQSRICQLSIKCADLTQAIETLSGGNQQKAILARWISRGSNILLLDEPTRGVDASSKLMIHAQLESMRESGCAILMVASEIEELMSLCDYILVLSNGKLASSFVRGDWSSSAILDAAFSEHLAKRKS